MTSKNAVMISSKLRYCILQITDIQREGVAFMEAMGSGINAFDVGVVVSET